MVLLVNITFFCEIQIMYEEYAYMTYRFVWYNFPVVLIQTDLLSLPSVRANYLYRL